MRTHHSVAIAGAGLGGLTLARVLHRAGIEVAVFEGEDSRAARAQGGLLDIHEETGQAALRAAGLHEEFTKLTVPGGQATLIRDKHARLRLANEDDGNGTRPEIDRGLLRDLLLDALPEGTVRWGTKVTGARPLDGARHEVELGDGTSFTTDLLVGADGAWSRVRPLLSAALPVRLGVTFVELDHLDADNRHPAAAALVGGGMLFALGEGRGFLAHREGDGSLHVYVALAGGADWVDAIDFSDPVAARSAVLEHFTGWDEGLRALVTEADGALVPRPLHALPVGHRWDRVPGVTLLGDAAHLMSPFAGEGANLAMIDGADLAGALAAHPGDTEAALAAYEATMFPRAGEAAAASAASMATCFDEEAPQGLVDQFAAHAAA